MRSTRFLWLPVAAAAIAAGCGDDPVRVAGNVQGTWAFVDSVGSAFYLRIADDEIIAWNEDAVADCFERVQYEVLEVDGRDFRLGLGDEAVTIELFRDEDELVLASGNVEVRYQQTGTNPETLPVCPPPSVDAACSEQPALDEDADVEGSLEAADPANPDGTRFDLYRLDVAATDSFRIDMSASIDSRLVLFDSLGVLIEENDDASSLTFDARIAHTLTPGCHLVMATSALADAFGDYELSVSLP